MDARRRPLAIAAVLVALVAGAALAAVLGGEDEVEPAGTTTADTGGGEATGGGDATGTATGERTATGEPTTGGTGRTVPPSDERGIEQAVSEAVEATELGRPPAGIEPGDLPGSDELSIESVRARGDRGSATLSSGAVVELRRADGGWQVTGVRGAG